MESIINDFFKITHWEHNDCIIKTDLELNKNNEIFAGHFPGQPVLPGACELQMVKEILAFVFETPVRLKKADQIKFLNVTDPRISNILQMSISYKLTDGNKLDITASLTSSKGVCFKFRGSFIKK